VAAAAAPSCSIIQGIELKGSHYKQLNTTSATVCCNACIEDGDECGGWKICTYSSGRACRLLPKHVGKQQSNPQCTAGTMPLRPTPPPAPTPPPPAGVCDVRKYGAKADGKTSNTKAIAAAVADKRCFEILFPSPGTYLSGTIMLRSNLILNIEKNAILMGKDGEFAEAQPNKWDQYQDYGHSHWHDSFIVGDGIRNVTIRGDGLIHGGNLSSGTPKHSGGGCRLLALRSCQDVSLLDFHAANGGWFTLLATDVDGLTIRGLTVKASRDGLDVVGCRNVLVEDVDISGGGDDAMVLKSDFSVGRGMCNGCAHERG
jgi:hypothetical protein